MKSSIRHGAVLRCDMVTVSDDGATHNDRCEEVFVSYSISPIVRHQALGAGWRRAKIGHVKWPGEAPGENAKKVDLCPQHAKLVATDDELKALKEKQKEERKAERAAARAEAKAEKKRQREAARETRKAVKKQTARKTYKPQPEAP